MKNIMQDKLESIYLKHGYNEQIGKLGEELNEFVTALTFLRAYNNLLKEERLNYDRQEYLHLVNEVEKEYGDVLNVMEQFKIVFNLSDLNINKSRMEKIERQCKRDNI